MISTVDQFLDLTELAYITLEDVHFLVFDRVFYSQLMPEIPKIMENPTMRHADQRQTLMFSPTFNVYVKKLADRYLNGYVFLALGYPSCAMGHVVVQVLVKVTANNKAQAMSVILRGNETANGIIVLVKSEAAAKYFAVSYKEVSHFSEKLSLHKSEELLDDFATGKIKMLTATPAAINAVRKCLQISTN